MFYNDKKIKKSDFFNSKLSNNPNILKYSKVIFTIALFMIILRKYMTALISTPSTQIVLIQSALFYVSIGLLGVLFLMDGNKKRIEILLLVFCVALYLLNRNGTMIVFVLLASGIKNISDNYVVKNYLIISTFLLCGFVLIFNLFPELQSASLVAYRFSTSSFATRFDFELGNPNSAYFFMLPILCSYIFLRFKDYNVFDRVLIIVLTIFIYSVTASRTGFYTIVVGLILLEAIRYINIKDNVFLPILAKIAPILISLISIFMGMKFYNSTQMNNLLSSRPKYWHVYLAEAGNFLKPFGNSFGDAIKAANPLDNSYIYLVSVLGLVTFVLFLALMYVGIDILIKSDNKVLLAILFIFLIYGFAENIIFESGLNFTLVLLLKVIINNNKNEINIYKIFNR